MKKHKHYRHVQILMVALAISATANVLPFMARAQLTFPWSSPPPIAPAGNNEYWCNGRPQPTPCSSASSSRVSSALSSSRSSSISSSGWEYWCNGHPQPTPCSSSSSSRSSVISSACTSSAPPPAIDLSVLLDSEQPRVSPGQNVTYTVKVRNGSQDTAKDVSVWMLRNDMTFVESSVYCLVQASDPTYVRCNVPTVPAGQSITFTVTMQTAPDFTCIDSTGGRSVFAFVRTLNDYYPQNDTSNIVNTMPTCW